MRTFDYRVNVHGTAFFPEYSGPGALRNVSDIHWSDQQGLRRGSGVTFRGEAGRDNYFHVSIPTMADVPLANPFLPGEPGSLGNRWKSVTAFFSVSGPVDIFHVGLFDGPTRFFHSTLRPRLDLRPGRAFTIPEASRRPITQGAGLSIGVSFGSSDSTITFHAAHGVFETAFLEAGDPRP